MDTPLVEHWLRLDITRWIAGAFAGLFAGLVAMGLAMFLAVVGGHEAMFPAKLMATIVLGPQATIQGGGSGAVVTGFFVFEAICLFYGVVFGHFTFTNRPAALMKLGLVWGAFSWIFVWNLFLQSFNSILWAQVPSAPAFFVCLTYGLGMTSVAFFDRAMRGNARR